MRQGGFQSDRPAIRVASGEKLRHRQRDIRFTGHAIECRLNAEDPDRKFAPCPGTINLFIDPVGEGVRLDSHAYSGYRVPPNYDSLVGKLVTHGRDRSQAIERMQRAISELVLDGIKTTLPFHRELMGNHKFIRSEYDLNFVHNMLDM